MWLDPDLQLLPMGGKNDTMTISGFSGGSSTATDMHTIHSDMIKGAGLVGGGPYGDFGGFKQEHNNPPENYSE